MWTRKIIRVNGKIHQIACDKDYCYKYDEDYNNLDLTHCPYFDLNTNRCTLFRVFALNRPEVCKECSAED